MDCIISSVMRGRALYRNHMGIAADPGKVLKFQRLGEIDISGQPLGL
jgi:hypothetical protein